MNRVRSTFIIPSDLLDDIASRSILDAADEELNNPIKLCFLTELAFWFYLDEYVEEDKSLTPIRFESFALQLLQHLKIEPKNGKSIEEMLQDFREFKLRVPTYGGMLLNKELTHVLLVQGFWHKTSWGFPKGKINVEEEPHSCAIREVLEETGFDIANLIDPTEYFDNTIGEQKVRLYIIPGVPLDTVFRPKTKGEIKETRWFQINDLPVHKNDRSYPAHTSGPTNTFYMVMPFVKPLREWVAMKRAASEGRRRHTSLSTDQSLYIPFNNPPPPYRFNSQSPLFPNGEKCNVSRDRVVERRRINSENTSQSKKDVKLKNKGKKSNVAPDIGDENLNPQHQKFTFKSRSRGNSATNQGSNAQSIKSFKSTTWQNFKLNKRMIYESLDKVWSS